MSEVRYRLIADYIGNTQPVGYEFKSQIGEYYDKFPANFKKLKWYEGLSFDEMPTYVRYKNEVHKVLEWNSEFGTSEDDIWLFYNDIIPATEKEFFDYKTVSAK